MTNPHLDMEQLLAVRDGDRSEPRYAEGFVHLAGCPFCQAEVERLHQRTARLRALPQLAPDRDRFSTVRARLDVERKHRHWRNGVVVGLAAAAAVVLIVGHDMMHPADLDAEQQLQSAVAQSQQLEQTLHQWHPDQRVVDGHTAAVVAELENRIAQLDAQIDDAARLQTSDRLPREVALWQQRVGLMNALIDVHLTKAGNVGL